MNPSVQQFQPAALLSDYHDWAYEKFSQQADLHDVAFESFSQDFKANLLTDFRCKVFSNIDSTMELVLDSIYHDTQKSEQFVRLIFNFWHSPDCFWKAKELSDLLDKQFDHLIEEQFKKENL